MRAIYEDEQGRPKYILYSDPRYMFVCWVRVDGDVYVYIAKKKARFIGPEII